MQATLKDNKLTIVIDANVTDPKLSASGKTRLIASESAKTTVVVSGKPVTISLNAYFKV